MRSSASREGRGWPGYIFGGRLRTTTAALLIAFCAIWWLYETYEPAPAPQQIPAREVVPPGFIPDPDYTWAPRTDVQRHTPETTTTTTPTTPTTTTATSPTMTTTPVPGGVPAEPGSSAPQPAPETPAGTAEPSRATEAPAPSASERPRPTTPTPAAAADGPVPAPVSPPQ